MRVTKAGGCMRRWLHLRREAAILTNVTLLDIFRVLSESVDRTTSSHLGGDASCELQMEKCAVFKLWDVA